MKSKIIGSGLALSLLLGGAAFNSTAAKAAPIDEAKNITVESANQNIEPPKELLAVAHRLAAKGAAWVGGYFAHQKAAREITGSSSSDAPSYEYEDVKSSFDL
ncbi:hypothetical protein [Bacillus cereus]|uniref:hypothetical protein n=1 Tax=Bacillus cereus TaxID=1396 RepID=UPI000BED8F83|nr:hypothetical protein [Bacillus cereus]PED02971.1 hypothetical protein CON14_10145 [Bacillus cereus]PFB68039.1 hypothetical protein CN292_20785 [Bacillus cereus]PFC12008.1 hypothetical protein CN287_28830 [Bacillus cereus]PFC93988.1 hypothetical protein CN289_29040 [Bacillus cereus]PFD15882.1 hypothetical protein CN305_24215 [Bacillus cereus]